MRAMRFSSPAVDAMSPEQLKLYQEERLRAQVAYAVNNSEYYRQAFAKHGIEPGDIRTLEDWRQVPILMNKEDERRSQEQSLERFGHPFGMHLCCDPQDLRLTATTSGTTGTPTFTYTHTAHDQSVIREPIMYMMEYLGVRPGDRVLFAHALGVYATTALLQVMREGGVFPIDVDVRGGAEAILKFAKLTRPKIAMMTPSLAEHLIDRAPEILGTDVGSLGLQGLLMVGEIAVGIPEVKKKLEDAYGCRAYDWIAPLGDCLAFSGDSDDYHGMAAVSPHTNLYPVDLVDPETKAPLEITNGVVGEAIYTSLYRKASPALKYASGDIIQVFTEPCPATGFRGHRLKVVGRSDDMLIVKGVNIYPSAIKQVVNEFVPEVTGEIRVVLKEKPPRVTPPLVIRVEYGRNTQPSDLEGLEARIKALLHQNLRVTPVFEWVAPGSLGKAMTKTPLLVYAT